MRGIMRSCDQIRGFEIQKFIPNRTHLRKPIDMSFFAFYAFFRGECTLRPSGIVLMRAHRVRRRGIDPPRWNGEVASAEEMP